MRRRSVPSVQHAAAESARVDRLIALLARLAGPGTQAGTDALPLPDGDALPPRTPDQAPASAARGDGPPRFEAGVPFLP